VNSKDKLQKNNLCYTIYHPIHPPEYQVKTKNIELFTESPLLSLVKSNNPDEVPGLNQIYF